MPTSKLFIRVNYYLLLLLFNERKKYAICIIKIVFKYRVPNSYVGINNLKWKYSSNIGTEIENAICYISLGHVQVVNSLNFKYNKTI